MEQDICMKAGDSRVISVTLNDVAKLPINLSGSEIDFQLARRVDSPMLISKNLSSGIEIQNPEDGKFRITLNPEDTQDLGGRIYYYEVQVILGDGSVSTVLHGNFEISKTLIPS